MLHHNNFYILGLPRCRSLWSSFLFTGSNSYCHHEAIHESVTSSSLRPRPLKDCPLIGSSDTTPLSFDEALVDDSPLILIHRDLSDVKKALKKSHGFTQDMDPTWLLERSHERLNEIETDNTMHVNYGELSDPNVIRRMLSFTGVQSEPTRINKMIGSRIVVNNPYLWLLKTTN